MYIWHYYHKCISIKAFMYIYIGFHASGLRSSETVVSSIFLSFNQAKSLFNDDDGCVGGGGGDDDGVSVPESMGNYF